MKIKKRPTQKKRVTVAISMTKYGVDFYSMGLPYTICEHLSYH